MLKSVNLSLIKSSSGSESSSPYSATIPLDAGSETAHSPFK